MFRTRKEIRESAQVIKELSLDMADLSRDVRRLRDAVSEHRLSDIEDMLSDVLAKLNPPKPQTAETLATVKDGEILTAAALRDLATRVLAVEKKVGKRGKR